MVTGVAASQSLEAPTDSAVVVVRVGEFTSSVPCLFAISCTHFTRLAHHAESTWKCGQCLALFDTRPALSYHVAKTHQQALSITGIKMPFMMNRL